MTNKRIDFKFLNLKHLFVIFVYLYICLFVYSGVVSAQQLSLSITPPLLQLVIKPGKSIMVAYNIENFGDPVILTSKLVNFEPKDDLGNIKLKDDLNGPIRFSLDNADLQLGRPFFLKTGASQQLLLRIRVPDGSPEGDYYYTLLAESTPPNGLEGVGSARAKASIGSNILITVTNSGIIEVKPKVVLFKTLGNVYDSFDKIPMVFVIGNQGKNMIQPEGQITLKGDLGEELNYDIVPKNILAQSERMIEATPSADTAFSGKPVSLVLSGFFIGLYHLSTSVTFGENSPTVFASTSFFVFPFKLLAGIVIVIVVTIVMVKKFSKNDDED